MTQASRWKRFIIILYLSVIHLMAFFFILGKINGRKEEKVADNGYDANASGTVNASIDSDKGLPSQTIVQSSTYTSTAEPTKLMIPVVGVKREDLQDTYTQSRSGGRVHNACDIMAAEGTPVVATADGEIAKFFDSEQGGITIYQWGADHKYVFYYAHLQRRADGIAEHSLVKRGTVIGYVGNTGNAGAGNYHLHFSIILPTSPDRHWEGTNINPYPLLKDGIEVPAVRE